MSGDRSSIEADFEVIRVQTMTSNAVRVVLEMPEHMIPQMAMFAECQRNGIYLRGVFTAIPPKNEEENGRDTGKHGKIHI